MIRSIFKIIIANYLTLFIVSNYLVHGLLIENGFMGYTKVVIVLTVVFPLIKPLVKILFIPVNMVTLGLFNFIIDAFLLYLLTIIVSDFRIISQTIPAINIGSFHSSPISPGRFGMILIISFSITIVSKIIRWFLR